jgi:proprotein convertase subtilisin/kexin type 5
LNCLQCTFVANVLTGCSSCLTGYYPSGVDCLLCPSTCISCTGSSSCTKCHSTYIIDSSGICACATSYGLFPLNGVCKLCEEIIYGCETCDIDSSSNTICKSCISQYYLSSNICLPCDQNCLTCDILPTNCTSCRKG